MATPLTINEYLQILPNYTFEDRIINRVLAIHNIESGEAYSNIEKRTIDLAEADMWEAAASLVTGGGQTKKFGNRSFSTMAIQATQAERDLWLAKAKSLRLGETFENNEIIDMTKWG